MMYSEFQYFLAEYVSSDGLPHKIDSWSADDLLKLIEYARQELDRRDNQEEPCVTAFGS